MWSENMNCAVIRPLGRQSMSACPPHIYWHQWHQQTERPEVLFIASGYHKSLVFPQRPMYTYSYSRRFNIVVLEAAEHPASQTSVDINLRYLIFEDVCDRGVFFLSVWRPVWNVRLKKYILNGLIPNVSSSREL